MKIALCQTNFTTGNIKNNTAKIISKYKLASAKGFDLVVFPELALTGYPLYDLANNRDFIDLNNKYIEKIVASTNSTTTGVLFGALVQERDNLFNAGILASRGEILGKVYKNKLPNYSVFNEPRNFVASNKSDIIFFKGERLGILICEDMWYEDRALHYSKDGASILISINSSPFEVNKVAKRRLHAARIVEKTKIPLLYLNKIGSQDDLVFDGGSFILSKDCSYIAEPQFWQETDIEFCTKSLSTNGIRHQNFCETEHIYQALMSALRNFVSQNHFKQVILGLSGGIDSALVATIASDSLGAKNVHCVMMPTKFTSQASKDDAANVAAKLGCTYETVEIASIQEQFLALLRPSFGVQSEDVTEENLQARIRGVVLMGLSNKLRKMLIATSNKSEAAVGYATLYGDMCGSYALIKDLYKTEIYRLAIWRNQNIPEYSACQVNNPIPVAIVQKEPSAELRLNQKDSDSLPPYELLDKILFLLIEQQVPVKQVAQQLSIDLTLVEEIKHKIKRSEFKRQQAPLGPKISCKSFNTDRIYPISY